MSKLEDLVFGYNASVGTERKFIADIKALMLELINEATQPTSTPSRIKSLRNRSYAFKLYAVKHFNGKMKERREKLRQKVEEL